MDLEHAHLHERDEPGGGIDHRVLRASRRLLDLDGAYGLGEVPTVVLLEEAVAALAARTAKEGERTAGDVRENAGAMRSKYRASSSLVIPCSG